MVVAGQDQNAAVRRRARVIAVLEGIAGAINAGALAVPDGKHAVIVGRLNHAGLLAAPAGGGRHVFVDAGLKLDVVRFEIRRCSPERRVITAQR